MHLLETCQQSHIDLAEDYWQSCIATKVKADRNLKRVNWNNNFLITSTVNEPSDSRIVKHFHIKTIKVIFLYLMYVRFHDKLCLSHSSSISMDIMCFPGTMASPSILGSSFSSATKKKKENGAIRGIKHCFHYNIIMLCASDYDSNFTANHKQPYESLCAGFHV